MFCLIDLFLSLQHLGKIVFVFFFWIVVVVSCLRHPLQCVIIICKYDDSKIESLPNLPKVEASCLTHVRTKVIKIVTSDVSWKRIQVESSTLSVRGTRGYPTRHAQRSQPRILICLSSLPYSEPSFPAQRRHPRSAPLTTIAAAAKAEAVERQFAPSKSGLVRGSQLARVDGLFGLSGKMCGLSRKYSKHIVLKFQINSRWVIYRPSHGKLVALYT